MKRCKRCNKLLRDTAKYCTTCGAACDDTPKPTEAKPAQSEAAHAPLASDASANQRADAPKKPAASSKKKRARRKNRRITLALFVVAAIIVVAIVIVAVKGCKKGGGAIVTDASLGNGLPASVAPDAASARVETPSVTGLTLPEATAKLTEMGLVADVYEAGYDPAYGDSVVLSQSVEAGSFLTKGEHVTLSVNALPLSLEVLQTSVRSGRITLGNIPEICRAMNTTNPNFDYSIVIHAVEDYEFKGGFRCLVGANEETPLSRVNTQLLREGALVNGLSSAVAYKDAIVWTFALDDWMGFHFDNVTGYDVTLSSRVDAFSAAQKSFLPSAVKSMALVDCPANTGRIRVDIPTNNALTIRITDDALETGYSNSPNGTGSGVPKWEIKLVQQSYLWISATIDGTNGEPQGGMQASGTQFTKKGAKPTAFSGVTYTVEGNVMVVSVPIPQDISFDPTAISYMELSFGDGAYTEKIKIQ